MCEGNVRRELEKLKKLLPKAKEEAILMGDMGTNCL